MSNTLYERDFFAWAREQATLLRSGRLSDADIGHIAKEIESMGRSERRELVSLLAVLLTHLLKWQCQPDRRGASWQATIRVQRRVLVRRTADNSSLNAVLVETIAEGFGDAVIEAAAATGLPETLFPVACPWPSEQVMGSGFWPGRRAEDGGAVAWGAQSIFQDLCTNSMALIG